MSSKALSLQIKSIGDQLSKKALAASQTSCADHPTECIDLLNNLKKITVIGAEKDDKSETQNRGITISILNETKIGLSLNKLLKSFRRFRRSNDNDSGNQWRDCMDISQQLLDSWKDTVKKERESSATIPSSADGGGEEENANDSPGATLPSSVGVYKSRLITHKKEMYKDPPALPPASINIESTHYPLPKRNSSTGELTFNLSTHQKNLSESKLQQYIKDFKPNRTPEEVLRAGSFGGTYFRPIVSSVTNIKYNPSIVLQETVKPEWVSNLDRKTMLTSSTYKNNVNKYKVKCGGSLGMWESSGWIADSDPYGWFQWYCRFYQGRRCDDDERQISRWLKSVGPKGRFRSQLCNKILAQGGMTRVHDFKISPVIRQTLLHWGLEITEDVLRKHAKRVGKPC
jgi:hypothetical protein